MSDAGWTMVVMTIKHIRYKLPSTTFHIREPQKPNKHASQSQPRLRPLPLRMRPRRNIHTLPPGINLRCILQHIRRELRGPLLHETPHALGIVGPAEEGTDDFGVEEVRSLGRARVAVHEFAHEVRGDRGGVGGDFGGQFDCPG